MTLIGWLFRRLKIRYLKLTCEKCGRTYRPGIDGIVVTHDSVVRDFERILVVGGSYSSLMDTRKHPDLVDSCNWWTLEESTILEQREVISRIKLMLSEGEERWWQCNKCKTIQRYLPVAKGRGKKNIKNLKDTSDVERLIKTVEDTKDVEVLIKIVKHKNEEVRCEAVGALGKIKDPRAVKPLIKALKDKDLYVRQCAAEALGQIGDQKAMEPLIKALKDKDWPVRESAAEALGQIGDQKAIEALIEALRDKHSLVQWRAAEALSQIRDPSIEQMLTKTLDDKDTDVRKFAKDALKKIRARQRLKR